MLLQHSWSQLQASYGILVYVFSLNLEHCSTVFKETAKVFKEIYFEINMTTSVYKVL